MTNFFEQILQNPRDAIKNAGQQDNFVVVIQEALWHPDRNVRLSTLKNLYGIPKLEKSQYSVPIMKAVVEMIPDDDSVDVQREGIEALFRYGIRNFDRDFIHPIVPFALSHRSMSIRSLGLKLLQGVKAKQFIPDVDELIANDPDKTVKNRAIVLRFFIDKDYTHDALVPSVLDVCMGNDFYWRDIANRCFTHIKKGGYNQALEDAFQQMVLDANQYGKSLKREIEKIIGPPEEFTPDAMIFKLANIAVADYTDLENNWHKVEHAIGDGTAQFYKIGHLLYMQSRRQKMEDLYKTVSALARSSKIKAQIEADYKRVQGDIKRMER